MAKYFLATIIFLFGLALFAPAVVSAQVSFSEDTEILLEGYNPDISLWIKEGSTAQEVTVYSTYFEVDFYANSRMTVVSSDKYTLTLSPGIWVGNCYTDRYEVSMLAVAPVNDVKITPGSVCSVVGPPGGSAPVVGTPVVEEKPPVVEKPISEMTVAELQAKITEVQAQIATLRAQLIVFLRAKIAEIQTQIAELQTQLAELQPSQ